MYCICAKINRGKAVSPLYEGCPLLGVSVKRGSTVWHEMHTNVCRSLLDIRHIQTYVRSTKLFGLFPSNLE